MFLLVFFFKLDTWSWIDKYFLLRHSSACLCTVALLCFTCLLGFVGLHYIRVHWLDISLLEMFYFLWVFLLDCRSWEIWATSSCVLSAWASSSAFNRRLQVFFIIWPIQRQHPLLVQGKICTFWAPVSILSCLKLHMKSLLSRSSRIRCFFHGRLSELQFVKVRLIRLSVYSFHLCLLLASFSKWLASSVVEDKEDSRIQVIKKKSGKTLHSASLSAFIRIMLFHLQWVLDVRAESSYFK